MCRSPRQTSRKAVNSMECYQITPTTPQGPAIRLAPEPAPRTASVRIPVANTPPLQ
jgi:hypothetical protein